MTLRGATPAVVRTAIDEQTPLPGGRGFAGVCDGRLVRDVLGREPLFIDMTVSTDGRPEWAFTPTALDQPQRFPAGAVGWADPTQHWTLPTDRESATAPIDTLKQAIQAALADLPTDVPVAFSGGVDSGLIASATDGPLFVAGFPESHDLEAARAGAEALNRSLTVCRFDHDQLREAATTVARATGRTNAMDVAIATPLYLTAKRVAEAGFDRLAVGQGADELFGGYAKVAKAPTDPRVEADTVRGARDELLRTLPAQLERDVLAIRAAGVEPVTPLLDDRVVRAALALPEAHLVAGDRRKVGLREAVTGWVPESIRIRDKKALQYGTYASRELDRLARQAGFKRRMDDHVTKYLESLIAEA